MTNALTFEPTPDGLIVRMDGDQPIPVGEWTSLGDGSSGAGALIRLRDDGDAIEQDDGCSLSVSWRSVAGLTSAELRYIGLPDASPFMIEVVTNRAIHDADFELRYGFLRKGRRVLGLQREGAWLRVSGGDFVLLNPLYSHRRRDRPVQPHRRSGPRNTDAPVGTDCGDAACRRRCRRRQPAFAEDCRGFELRAQPVRQWRWRTGLRPGRRQARDARHRDGG